MKISTKDFRQERTWRASLGLDEKRFYILLSAFKKAYQTLYGQDLAKSLGKYNKDKYIIQNEEDLLIFTLFGLKNALSYDVLGVIFGMAHANAKKNQAKGIKVLAYVLEDLGLLPQREFDNETHFQAYFSQIDQVYIDATEQPIQRPQDSDIQAFFYSGKKKDIPPKF